MKYFSTKVYKKIFAEDKNLLLMLDFDGTLSNIAPTPKHAHILKHAKLSLKTLAKFSRVNIAIISGRSLKDIKNKVSLNNLIYAGNHGLEWQIGKKTFTAPIPIHAERAIRSLRREFVKLTKNYPGTFVEDKKIAFSIHYRLLKKRLHKKFVAEVDLICKKFSNAHSVNLIKGKKTFDFKPAGIWNKGSFAKLLIKKIKNKPAQVVYIGDDITDEDAFKALTGKITVFVGKKNSSHAKFFLKNPAQVSVFLNSLVQIQKNRV